MRSATSGARRFDRLFFLFGWLFKILGLDFSRQIVAIARKP